MVLAVSCSCGGCGMYPLRDLAGNNVGELRPRWYRPRPRQRVIGGRWAGPEQPNGLGVPNAMSTPDASASLVPMQARDRKAKWQ
jgi:hypothetical protein